MARINNLSNFLQDVADAIKEKKGDSTAIQASTFDIEILALPSQGNYEQKSVTISSNGTTVIEPSQDYDAIDQLTITTNVPNDTSDATATINDVLFPKTFYDKQGKKTGNIQTEYVSGETSVENMYLSGVSNAIQDYREDLGYYLKSNTTSLSVYSIETNQVVVTINKRSFR